MSAPLNADAIRARSVIVNFAGRVSGADRDDKAVSYATDHGWLAADGSVTIEGQRLVDALGDQSGVRSVFRHL